MIGAIQESNTTVYVNSLKKSYLNITTNKMSELARRIQLVMDSMDVLVDTSTKANKKERFESAMGSFIDLFQSHSKEDLLIALWELQEDKLNG